MLSPGDSSYREWALTRLDRDPGHGLRPLLLAPRVPRAAARPQPHARGARPAAQQTARLLSTPQVDVVLRHPYSLDIEGAIARGEVIVVNGAKAVAGEDNTKLLFQLLLRLCTAPSRPNKPCPRHERRKRVALRRRGPQRAHPGGRHACSPRAAPQDSRPALPGSTRPRSRDELVRSGVRSLLQSISIFRMRELEDARSLAGLAMDVYCDRISIDQARPGTAALLRRRHHPPARPHRHQPLGRPRHTAARLRRPNPPDGGRSTTRRSREHHLEAQRERGGHHLTHLPAPLGDKPRPRADRPRQRRRPARTDTGTAPARRRRARPADEPPTQRRSSYRWRSCSRAGRQLRRRPPLRRRHHPAPTLRGPRTLRAAPTRPRHRPRRLALPLPHHRPAPRALVARQVGTGRTPAARQALPRRLPRTLPPLQPARLLRMDLLPRRARTPPAARPRCHRPQRPLQAPRRLRLRPRAPRHPAQRLGARLPPPARPRPARLARRTPDHTAASQPARPSCASTTTGRSKGCATRSHARSSPTPRSRSPTSTPTSRGSS